MPGRQGRARAAAAAAPASSPTATQGSPAVLLLCALPREARALGATGPLAIGEPAPIGPRTRVLATGAGPAAALACVDSLAPALDADAVLVSLGVAGALHPTLAAGDLVLADALISEADGTPATLAQECATLLQTRLGDGGLAVRTATLLSTDRVLASASEKSQVRARWPAAALVDMESHAYARSAARHGLRFVALRAIIDTHEMSIPPAALQSLNAAGETQLISLIGSVLGRPSQLPALLRLGGAWQRARRQLVACGKLLAPLEHL